MSLETTTIGELNSGAPLVTTDQFVIERVGGANFKITGADIATFIGAGFVSPLTTKGDIMGFDTVDNRIPVGADGQFLAANDAQALGVEWVDPPSGGSTPVLFTDTTSYNQGEAAPDWYYSIDFNESDTVVADFMTVFIPKATTMTTLRIEVVTNTVDAAVTIAVNVDGSDSGLTLTIPALTVGSFTISLDVPIAVDDNVVFHVTEGGGGTIGFMEFKPSYSWN